ncbi:hypothetical protein P3T76_001634 [Phytophthora citrophthora]|uniref:Uncharacterized protein n=1 Tax=Phytophthora citrophthora TaxID=4793 RepID=A0AAD9GYV6_9STRA|nr:hypothetical protein P3T76_001634 [Phytophthora citrophthora]
MPSSDSPQIWVSQVAPVACSGSLRLRGWDCLSGKSSYSLHHKGMLRGRHRTKNHQKKLSTESSMTRPKRAVAPQSTDPARAIRAMQIAESEYGSDLDKSGPEGEVRRAYFVASSGQKQADTTMDITGSPDPKASTQPSTDSSPQGRRPHYSNDGQRCSHCGYCKHSEREAIRRIVLHCLSRMR